MATTRFWKRRQVDQACPSVATPAHPGRSAAESEKKESDEGALQVLILGVRTRLGPIQSLTGSFTPLVTEEFSLLHTPLRYPTPTRQPTESRKMLTDNSALLVLKLGVR